MEQKWDIHSKNMEIKKAALIEHGKYKETDMGHGK